MTNTANIERGRAVSQPDTFAPVSVFGMTINPQHGTGVALDISRGSGAVRGSACKQAGRTIETKIRTQETGQGGLEDEQYVEADPHDVTLKVWRPGSWVTDGGRRMAFLPPFLL